MKKLEGYTEVVKIAEASLNGDKEKSIRYMKIYIDKFPNNDLSKAFTNLLEGKNSSLKLEKENY